MRSWANRLEAADLDSREIARQARFESVYQRFGASGAAAMDLRRIHSLRLAE
jgi:hypothetical protein